MVWVSESTVSRLLLVLVLVELSCAKLILPVISNPKPFKNVDMPNIPSSVVEEAFRSAQQTAANRDRTESQLPANGGIIPQGEVSARAKHQRFLLVTPQSMRMEDNQEKFEGAAQYLIKKYRLTPDQVTYGLPRVVLTGSASGKAAVQQCQAQYRTSCADSKFRTADGTCNNKQNPIWGRSNTCFERLIPPKYVDGVSVPRVSVVGANPLPNARVVSLSLHNDLNVESRAYTHMTMQWGQFMDHDLTFTPMTRAGDSMMMIECCNAQGQPHPECFPIGLPSDDPFFSQFSERCLNFVRSATCSDCKLGPRQQTNQLTAFIDGSQIYGSTQNDTNQLRSFRNGELRAQFNNRAGELLPESNDIQNDQCSRPRINPNGICFLAGDGRVNEQPALATMHTLWLRQHNRIARIFKRLLPSASDEAIFQETRRVVIAQLQMITYNEFLPTVLGRDFMNYFHLYPQDDGYTLYEPSTQPSIVHEFATAAYRFGHTLIQNAFSQFGGSSSSFKLRDNFFFPFGLYNGDFDPILQGLFRQSAKQYDRHIVEDVTDHLYKERGANFGMDLPALNIQRGRDHGLQGYTAYLDYCFDIKINSFQDLINTQIMPLENANRLANVYDHPSDIDLFVGGVMEDSLPGAVVGPTFGCIIGLQFYHLKFGDRYFFEHDNEAGRFSPNKLNEIRQKTTLSQVICANSASISSIQYKVFQPSNNNNGVGNCQSLPDIDFRYWANDNSE